MKEKTPPCRASATDRKRAATARAFTSSFLPKPAREGLPRVKSWTQEAAQVMAGSAPEAGRPRQGCGVWSPPFLRGDTASPWETPTASTDTQLPRPGGRLGAWVSGRSPREADLRARLWALNAPPRQDPLI